MPQHSTKTKKAAKEFIAKHRKRPGYHNARYVIRKTKNKPYPYFIYIYT